MVEYAARRKDVRERVWGASRRPRTLRRLGRTFIAGGAICETRARKSGSATETEVWLGLVVCPASRSRGAGTLTGASLRIELTVLNA